MARTHNTYNNNNNQHPQPQPQPHQQDPRTQNRWEIGEMILIAEAKKMNTQTTFLRQERGKDLGCGHSNARSRPLHFSVHETE